MTEAEALELLEDFRGLDPHSAKASKRRELVTECMVVISAGTEPLPAERAALLVDYLDWGAGPSVKAIDVIAARGLEDAVVPLIAAGLGQPGRMLARLQLLSSYGLRLARAIVTAGLEGLLASARDPDWFTRSQALSCLLAAAHLDDPRIMQALVAGLADEEESVQQSACATIHFGKYGERALPAVPRLIELLASANDIAAAGALGSIGPAAGKAVEALQSRAKKGDPAGKDAAREALARIKKA
jgi:hypothetical protein